MKEHRGNFTGNLGFILVAAGSAVGLGNIWKFPTLAGNNGGGIFIILYLIFVAIMGVPLILSESTIGRYAKLEPRGAYEKIAKEAGCGPGGVKFWSFVGLIAPIGVFLIMSYYSVIAGWVLIYLLKIFTVPVSTFDMTGFGITIGQTFWPIVAAFVCILIGIVIVSRGIQTGVEKAGRIMMPMLIIMLIVCSVCGMTRPGASEGIKFMLVPDMDRVRAAGGLGKVTLAALGQCFFSLSLGIGQMITLGSYLEKDTDLLGNAYSIPIVDTFVALLAGFATLTAVFAASSATGIGAQTGPGMLMYALPQSLIAVFGSGLGTALTGLTFLLVLFAAMTTINACFEVIVAYMIDSLHWNRAKSSIVCAAAVMIGAIICSLSNGVLSGFTVGGLVIQDLLDWICANLIMPFGSLMVCLFIGYVWKPQNAIREITNDGTRSFGWSGLYTLLVKYVIPLIILVVFLTGVGVIPS